jgi:hypothetical protein
MLLIINSPAVETLPSCKIRFVPLQLYVRYPYSSSRRHFFLVGKFIKNIIIIIIIYQVCMFFNNDDATN